VKAVRVAGSPVTRRRQREDALWGTPALGCFLPELRRPRRTVLCVTTESVSGIHRSNVDPWLMDRVGAAPPVDYRLIAGGRSNLTFAVADSEGQHFVLRRPPLGRVLQSAHDMGREYRIISALAPTPVPVPRPLAFCSDPAVNEAPFYVMEFVEGIVVSNEEDVERHLDHPARAEAGQSLVEVLANLHALDPDSVGLGDLGRKDGYVQRQLRRWHAQFEKSKSREIAALEEVHRVLEAHIPPQQRTAIVHGDYRLGNCLLGPDGRVRAVLDWELCTLGDPLADLGWFVGYWIEPGASSEHLGDAVPTTAPGFSSLSTLVERYVQRIGADVSDLDFYVALAYWKLACIAEGVYSRYRAGVMGGEVRADEADAFGRQVFKLADEALALCERIR
jgi:aminoglycoside phosphotransferase (APT) family kinase protein